MKIIVKLFSRPITLEVSPSDKVIDLKLKIKSKENIEPQFQRLVHLRKPLDDDSLTLEQCCIKTNAIVYLRLMLFSKN